jgi:ketosteroid isomerase-like protein
MPGKNWLRMGFALAALVLIVVISASRRPTAELETDLIAVETAFAKTMADRDLEAFRAYLDEDVIFFSGDRVMRGRSAVSEGWSKYFDAAEAPFSWKPESVAVLESGTLGMTSGPVYDPDGHPIGVFNSVWRRDANGPWRIVLDRGCDCP